MFNRFCGRFMNRFMPLLSPVEYVYLNSESCAGKRRFTVFQCQLENFGIVELWCEEQIQID